MNAMRESSRSLRRAGEAEARISRGDEAQVVMGSILERCRGLYSRVQIEGHWVEPSAGASALNTGHSHNLGGGVICGRAGASSRGV